MSSEEVGQESDCLSPSEMREWLLQEIRDSIKALELRVKEATQLVTDYALGKTTPEDATERCWQYQQRWGEALYGTNAFDNTPDEAIIAAIDEARAPEFTKRLAREDIASLFRKRGGR